MDELEDWRTENVSLVLGARAYLYALFHRALGDAPDAAIVEALGSNETLMALGFFLEGKPAFDRLAEAVTGLGESDVEGLASEYTALFVGPHKLIAPPWESVYIGDEGLLFQESTLEVRRTYLEDGMIPAEHPHVADDHIALELDYMALLARRFADEGDGEGALGLVNRQIGFLDKNLLVWTGEYARRMSDSRTRVLYPLVVDALSAFLPADRAVLDELGAAAREAVRP